MRVLIALFLAVFLVKGYFTVTDGFRVSKVLQGYPISYYWEALPSAFSEEDIPDEILPILNQEFSYLARGQQCYVFESDDGKYVLKLIRTHKERYPFWVYLPFFDEKRKAEVQWKESRRKRNANSYQLAKDILSEETGLIYFHLKQTLDLKRQITVRDLLGRKYLLDADNMQFLIQKKMVPLLSEIEKQKDDQEYMLSTIDSLFDWVSKRASKGVRNKNRRCMKNLGFMEGKIVEYDVGEFRINPDLINPYRFNKELLKSTKEFRAWLSSNAPDYTDYFDSQLKAHEKEH